MEFYFWKQKEKKNETFAKNTSVRVNYFINTSRKFHDYTFFTNYLSLLGIYYNVKCMRKYKYLDHILLCIVI